MSISFNQVINEVKEKNTKIKVCSCLLILIFLFSLIFFLVNGYSHRQVFLFESLDKKGLWVENRYFPRNKYINNTDLYISELLLGPIGERYKNVFAPGTKLISCFVRDNTMYVDLSKEALFPTRGTSEFMDGTEIFKKNVFRNFRNIDIIQIYIEGRKIFDD